MPDGAPRLGAVVAAAGGSSRMGTPKQVLAVGGTPLVALAAGAAIGAGASPVAVVVGAEADAVAAALAGLPVLIVRNPDWKSGLSSSIRAGLAALLEAEPGLGAVLVTPCDLPGLTAAALGTLANACRGGKSVAATRHAGGLGAPAVFGRDHFAALGALKGDVGARSLINAAGADVTAVDLPGLRHDLDTPEDLAGWRARSS